MKIERTMPLQQPASFSRKPAVEDFSQSFQEHMGQQQREDLKKRAAELLNELSENAIEIFEQVDFLKFEEYRRMISELIRDILNCSYICQSQRVNTSWGKPKIYSSVVVIDERLQEMGNEILDANSDRIKFLSQMDEIRGLVMDLLC
jgi:uncharacterized protein YaaR (DUF327 family)